VKAFLDTSILVPAFYTDHIHHAASFALLEKCQPRDFCCAAHTLAEVYSSLTRMPPPKRRSPEEAMLYLAGLKSKLTLIALDPEEYFRAIDGLAAIGVSGGTIYDGLLARCALKAKVQSIYTWNVRHFRQFGPEVEKRLRTP
jgi:predicted nucleic acid-binding protein